MKLLILLRVTLLFVFISSVESVIYTRWGRTTCPNGSEALYTGYVMGARYTHSGSGADYLCVADQPEWTDNIVPGAQPYTAWIQGAEYHLFEGYSDNRPFSFSNNGGKSLTDENPPCVACLRKNRNNLVMIPGRFSCPGRGMTLEYNGYLMASHRDQHKTSWICVDKDPEVIPGMSYNSDGVLLYPVQVSCAEGSVPCPPFVHGNELTCAVCSV